MPGPDDPATPSNRSGRRRRNRPTPGPRDGGARKWHEDSSTEGRRTEEHGRGAPASPPPLEEPAEPYDNLLEEPAEEPAGQEQPWGLLDECDVPQEGPLPMGALEQETPEQEKPEQEKPEQEKPEQEGHHCADNLVEKPRNVPEMALAETSHGEAA